MTFEQNQTAEGNPSGIRFIEPPTPNSRIVAAEFRGKFTAKDMRAYAQRIEDIVAEDQKASVFVDMRNYAGFELAAVAEKFKHLGVLWRGTERMAVVGNKRWLKA